MSHTACFECAEQRECGTCKVCNESVCLECVQDHVTEHKARPLESLALGADKIARTAGAVAELTRAVESRVGGILKDLGLKPKARRKRKANP